MKLPLLKNSDIVLQDLKDELLIYNLKTHKAFCLNETAKKVFEACGNQISFETLKAENKFDDGIIYLALDELKKENLIEYYNSPFVGMSRREVIRKVGFASCIVIPVITNLVAPVAVSAQSCLLQGSSFCVNDPANCVKFASNCNDSCPSIVQPNGICSGNAPGTFPITCACCVC